MTAEHLSISSHTVCPTGLQSAVCPHVPNTDNTGRHSQHCAGSVQEGGQPRESGTRFHSWQTETLLTASVTAGRHDLVASLYELSSASRTFMICCLMTLVASPALGIRYLTRGGKENVRSEETVVNFYQQTGHITIILTYL